MSADPFADRKSLTFEEAEGARPLPSQLQIKEISPKLRAALWAVLFEEMSKASHRGSLQDPWYPVLRSWWIFHQHKMADECPSETRVWAALIKNIITTGDYVRIFGFLQYVMRYRGARPYMFREKVSTALEFSQAAYCVLNDGTIVPIGSDAERETIQRAFADLAESEFHGARAHLQTAASELTEGRTAESVRESIQAVESVARVLEPTGDFSRALARLEKSAKIHGAMKSGFGSLYGYTSDEKGVRHPLLGSESTNVDENDALFMIGACAAFVSYLINKPRSAGLLNLGPN